MPLATGQTLSYYEILGPLGAGGMGEVYRARDSRLDRVVALKVLPSEMADDAERMARFEREAKVLASLQHPNIVTVHSIEEVDGVRFLTMELIEGKTLGASIQRGGLPLERFYPLAASMAEALHAAHQKGITHRDLKPDNVVVDSSGRVKVLDFGLAKVEEPARAGESTSAPLTGEGRAMGTIPYMAPEALRAGQVDSRSDVFALGVVLYELLTGVHPFPAGDPGERISAILRDTPALASDVRNGVSRELARLLRRCLEKDPDRRLQTALDLRNELEELAVEAASVRADAGEPRHRSRRVGAMLGVGAVLVIARASTTRRLTATSGVVSEPNWSPSSDFIAFGRHVSGSSDIFVKPLAGGEAVARTEGPGDESVPRWSPDNQTIAYMSTLEEGSPVFLVPPHSGGRKWLIDTNIPALEVKDIPTAMGDHPWSPESDALLVSRFTETGQLAIFRVAVSDGSSTQLTFPPKGCHDGAASYSFDGGRIAFSRKGGLGADLWTMSSTGSDQARLTEDVYENKSPSWRPDGEHIVFASNRGGPNVGLWEIDVATGDVEQLINETRDVYGHSVSASNRIAYSSFWHDTFFFVFELETGEVRQLTDFAGNNGKARFAPDGGAIAYGSDRDGDEEIWVLYLNGEPERQITFDPGADSTPDWSKSGERLVFVSTRNGAPELFLANSDGGGQQPLAKSGTRPKVLGLDYPTLRWSPDDELVGYVVPEEEGPVLWCVRPDGTDAGPRVTGVSDFDWYEDSRRIVYTSSAGQADELFACNLETGETRLLWKGKHAELDAAPDGRSVAFCTGEGHGGMSLARLFLEPPSDADGLPALRGEEPEILVQAVDRWHVHMGGWSWDSKRIVYTRDEDYSDVFELIERKAE